MPTYEYNCPNCGKFDVFQKISDDALKTCPTCGANVVRVINGGTGVIFKGTGFYTTDYGSKKSLSSSKGEDKSSEDKAAESKAS
ncbi:MAG: zinc ribbon domain-containing protein [Firmicutes bacterium]|nr:zinc ribbon domain-containing protein [Bacillota bacterium]